MSDTPIKNLTKNEIEALFHDSSDDEGHPSLGVWDIWLGELAAPHEDQGLEHRVGFTASAKAGMVEEAAPVNELLHQGEQLRRRPEEILERTAVDKVVKTSEKELRRKPKRKLEKEVDEGGETHSGSPDHTRVASKTDVIGKNAFDYEGYDAPGSTAAKRRRNKADHDDTAQDTIGDDNSAPLEQLDGTTEPEDAKQYVRQDTSVFVPPQRYSSPAADLFSPSIRSEHDTLPTSRQTTPRSEPNEIPTPASPRRSLTMSDAPPSYLPVKTRPKRSKNRDIKGKGEGKTKIVADQSVRVAQAKKEPRHQHPAPSPRLPSPTSDEINDQLSDTDPNKLWCYCGKPQRDGWMVACSYHGCRIEWFHLECFPDEPKPSENEDWFCVDHRGKNSQRLGVAYRSGAETVDDDASLSVSYRSFEQAAFTGERTADEYGTSTGLNIAVIAHDDTSDRPIDRSNRLAKRRKTGH